jgi:trafficking protein particle complex subunit 3
LAEFVELPEEALVSSAAEGGRTSGGLWYSNVLCGVVRGALEMVQYQVEAKFVSDVLRGDESTDMVVRLVRVLDEEVPQVRRPSSVTAQVCDTQNSFFSFSKGED